MVSTKELGSSRAQGLMDWVFLATIAVVVVVAEEIRKLISRKLAK